MNKVLVVMGSDSDYPKLKDAFLTLKRFGVSFDAVVCSAHRTPENAAKLSREAYEKGYKAIIAAAGLAAHLPGVIAAYTILPVIGIPIAAGPMNGQDALYSIVQMPSGVPVACVAINGAINAGLLAVQIISTGDPNIAKKLMAYKAELMQAVERKNDSLQKKISELG